jgi:hypothetical protein
MNGYESRVRHVSRFAFLVRNDLPEPEWQAPKYSAKEYFVSDTPMSSSMASIRLDVRDCGE